MSVSRWLASRLLLLSTVIALGIGALVFTQLQESRRAVWSRAQIANANLRVTVSQALENTLLQAVKGIDQSVLVMESHVKRTIDALNRAGFDVTPASALDIAIPGIDAVQLFAAMPQGAFGIQLVLDDKGNVLFASSRPPGARRAFGERRYFKVHAENPDLGVFVDQPFLSSFDGAPSVAISRRWNLPDGSFGGVVVQTWKLAVLDELFSQFTLAPESTIFVFEEDGTVVAEYPNRSGLALTTGVNGSERVTSLAGTPNFERFIKEKEGAFVGISVIDHLERLYVFGTLKNFPLLVSVSQSSASILQDWKHNAFWMASATLLLMGGCIWLAMFAERKVRAHRRVAHRLGRAERELRTIVDSLPVLVAYWDRDLVNRMANTAHRDWIGLSPEELRGRRLDELLSEDEFRELRAHLDAVLAGEPQTYERLLKCVDGSSKHIMTTLIPDEEEGRVKGFFIFSADITQRKLAELALLEEKERFRIILESIKDGVVTTDATGRVLYMNPAAAAMIGIEVKEALNRPLEAVMSLRAPDGSLLPDTPLSFALRTGSATRSKVEHVLLGLDGSRQHIEKSVAPMFDEDGKLRGAVVVFHEIGSLRAMANKMTHLAQHDALTGLPNRRQLETSGEDAIERAQVLGEQMAILYLDLDGFKQVNDEHGHAAGDELLVAMTRRLSARLRSSDRLFRQGGDEFVVLMESVNSIQDAEQVSRRLIESCTQPVSVSGKQFQVTVSIGIALFPEDGQDLATLIERADSSMYAAKNAGRNRFSRLV